MKMKKTALFTLLTLILCLAITACGGSAPEQGMWECATYTEDTELGSGSKTLYIDVSAEDKTVTFTVHSDKKTVGEALEEHGLIAGEEGPYGLYVKTVNGMLADYDVNQTYWSFSKMNESMLKGVDGTEFSDGDHYLLSCVK